MSAVLVEGGPDNGAIWHFGEPVKEQRALEAGKAFADLSHLPAIAISGADRLTWIHSLCTQDVEHLQPGDWKSGYILDPQGHVEFPLLMVDDGDSLYLFTEIASAEPLINFLNSMKFMLRVEVKDASSQVALFRAPGATDEIGGPYALVSRLEIKSMTANFALTAMQVGTWALDAIRVAAGRPRFGFESDSKTIPNELGVLNIAVHMNKGCYRGQETVAKVFNLGKPPRRLTLLHLDGSGVDLPASGSPITLDGKNIGVLGTVARHHELGPIALALIKRSVPMDATVTAGTVLATQEEIVAP
jgi:folate-binding protein YgfZ